MHHLDQVSAVHRFLEHLRNATTDLAPAVLRLPASVYTDAAHHRRERDRLWRERPVVAGLSADLPEPGSWFTADVGAVPLLVTRDADGRARAFVNGCRHRGGRIADGRGRAEGRVFRCPFHSWTYAIDGCLVAIPEAEDAFAALDRSAFGLHERSCAEHAGVILVRAVGDGPLDGADLLRGVAGDLTALGIPDYHHFETKTTEWKCNWKLALDTFLESYHVFSLHPESVHPWYFSQPMIYDGFGANLRFPVFRRTVEKLAERPESTWELADHAPLQWWVAPNALFSYTRDELFLWRFHSPRPDRCVAVTSLYTRSPATTEDATNRLDEAFALQLQVAGREDFPMQEKVQEVLGSRALPEIVFGRNEVAAIHFHRALEDLLAHDPEGDG